MEGLIKYTHKIILERRELKLTINQQRTEIWRLENRIKHYQTRVDELIEDTKKIKCSTQKTDEFSQTNSEPTICSQE